MLLNEIRDALEVLGYRPIMRINSITLRGEFNVRIGNTTVTVTHAQSGRVLANNVRVVGGLSVRDPKMIACNIVDYAQDAS